MSLFCFLDPDFTSNILIFQFSTEAKFTSSGSIPYPVKLPLRKESVCRGPLFEILNAGMTRRKRKLSSFQANETKENYMKRHSSLLETHYRENNCPSSLEISLLAQRLRVHLNDVQHWFKVDLFFFFFIFFSLSFHPNFRHVQLNNAIS